MKTVMIAILLAMTSTALVAAPYTLDWTDVDYTSGAIQDSFTNVDSSGVNMDFQFSSPNTGLSELSDGRPDDEQTLLSVYPNAEHGLWYATDDGGDLGLTITFSQLVTDVSFGIYDIDGSAYEMESVRIKAFDDLGNAFDITEYWYNAGSDIDVVTDGTADFGYKFISTGNDDTDPGDADWQKHLAEIGIDGSTGIRSIGISFVSDSNNRGQILTDISFSYVPEPATLFLLGIGSVALIRKKR